jgi:hypothetical protein
MARLFLTYKRADLDLARRLVDALRNRNHHVTIDMDYLVLGEEWRRALQQSFSAADGLVVLLTPNSVDAASERVSSEFVAADIGAARAGGKLVMPILDKGTPLPGLVDDIYSEWFDGSQPDEIHRIAAAIDKSLESYFQKRKELVSTFLLPGYEHLNQALRHFHQDAPYEKSVFVMMKFPEAHMPDEHRNLLNDIWRVVSDTLSQRGLQARRGDHKAYYDQLWENVCVYMFGCKYGLAILEDHVASELNPNVTLEYGFMKALNRSVGLFRAQDFRHDRADLTGKLSQSFTLDSNGRLGEESLKSAIHGWLSGFSPSS